jgi:hypothetical protein
MTKVLESRDAIFHAQKAFERSIRSHSSETISVTIGFQSGNTPANVHWLPSLNIWAFFGEPPLEKSPGERYWNVFGVGKPSGLIPIACEINSPKVGLNRQAAGAFAISENGKILLVHRGIFTAGGRVPYDYTHSHFRWKWVSVLDGSRTANIMPIGDLDSPNLAASVRDFIVEVIRFKKIARDHPWSGNG